MNETHAKTVKNRRRSSRVEAPDLFVSVKKKRWLVFEEYIDVETMDINRGGVGMIASDLNLKLLENVRLHFDYENGEYFIGGVVVYKHERDGLEFYGVMFTQIPHQFEVLLGDLIDGVADDGIVAEKAGMGDHEKTQKINIADVIHARQVERSKHLGNAAVEDARKARHLVKKISQTARETLDEVSSEINAAKTVPDTQRRVDARFSTDVLGVRVRSRGLASFVDFVSAEPGDISFGGLSFSMSTSEPRLHEKVRIELKYKNMVLRASGLVSYIKEENDRINYGVQFTMVPTKMKSLIRIMAANKQTNAHAAAK